MHFDTLLLRARAATFLYRLRAARSNKLLLYWLASVIPGTHANTMRRLLWQGPHWLTSSVMAGLTAGNALSGSDIRAYIIFRDGAS